MSHAIDRIEGVRLLCFCVSLISFCAQAASTADAKEPVSVDRECTLTICYGYDDVLFSDAFVKRYRIADVSADSSVSWTVMECNIPTGYTMTVEMRDTTFVLTNVRNANAPENPNMIYPI